MRLLCAVVLGGALMGGLAALWVLDHQRLRHDYFVARRAEVLVHLRETVPSRPLKRFGSLSSVTKNGLNEAFVIRGLSVFRVRALFSGPKSLDAPEP